MAYNKYRRKKKDSLTSPTKWVNALFGGPRRRDEQESAQEDFEAHMDVWDNQKMKNPYAGVKNPYANLENVYEDATVNLKPAQFQKEQSHQSMANIMQSMQGAAGGSGVAGLAQVLANQGVKQAQQASISIGQQEQANQLRASTEAGRLQGMERQGEMASRRMNHSLQSKALTLAAGEVGGTAGDIAQADADISSGLGTIGSAVGTYAGGIS